MNRKEFKRVTHPKTISGAQFIASLSIALAKIAQEIMIVDPNEWYSVFLMYIDQIASQAELLQEFWKQHNDELRSMGFEIPSKFLAVHHSVDEPLVDVFKELAKQYSKDTEKEGGESSIDDLPF